MDDFDKFGDRFDRKNDDLIVEKKTYDTKFQFTSWKHLFGRFTGGAGASPFFFDGFCRINQETKKSNLPFYHQVSLLNSQKLNNTYADDIPHKCL